MIKALIIDDELRARNILERYINTLIPEISEIKSAGSFSEARQILEQYEPNLVFLDIEMPQENGIEFLASLPELNFDVIFTTAHNQYAVQAIKFSALDYLLKPIDPDELIRAVKRHTSKHVLSKTKKRLFDNLIKNAEKKHLKEFRLAVPSNNGVFFFTVREIIRLEADRNYTVIHFTDKRPFVSSKTLKHFEDVLVPFKFVRTHKSHLINLEHVIQIGNNHDFLILSDDSRVEVARRKKEEVQKLLNIK